MYYLNNSFIKDNSLSINYLNIMKTIFEDKDNITRDFKNANYELKFNKKANTQYGGPLSHYKNHIQSLVTHTSRFLEKYEINGKTKTPISLEQYINRMFTRTDIKNVKRSLKSENTFDPPLPNDPSNPNHRSNPNHLDGTDTTIPEPTEKFYNNNAFDLSSINFFGDYLNENHSELVKFYLYFIDFILLHYSLDHYNF